VELRVEFPTLSAAADYLFAHDGGVGWPRFNAAVAAALIGRNDHAAGCQTDAAREVLRPLGHARSCLAALVRSVSVAWLRPNAVVVGALVGGAEFSEGVLG
jgi:hypothetical protein